MQPCQDLQLLVDILNDKQVFISALANILSLKKKNPWLAFVIFNTDNVSLAFKTFFVLFIQTAQFTHNKNVLSAMPLAPYNYS